MPYPDKPTISTSYTAKAQALGDGSLPGPELDIDLAALQQANERLNDFVRGITRSDGALANGIVRRESLGADVLVGFDAPTAWVTGKSYLVSDTVFESLSFYICLTAHTSGVFADDLASGRWALLADFGTATSDAEAARDAAQAALDDFTDQYLGPAATDPATDLDGDALVAGALYFNTASDTMRVYSGTAWADVSNSAVLRRFVYTATGGQTAFTGADDDGATLLYDPGFESVYLNGVKLIAGSDYTRTSTSVLTLAAGATAGDAVEIVAQAGFTSIEQADLSEAQTVSGDWTFTGTTDFSSGSVSLPAGSVGSDALAANAVITAKINNQAVTSAKLASAALRALANTITAANKIPYATGAGTAGELDFVDEDDMASDSATALPSQQSVKAYVDGKAVGIGQSWQDVSGSRAVTTSYQNTTGRPIMVSVVGSSSGDQDLEVSTDNSTWVVVGRSSKNGTDDHRAALTAIIPASHYYRLTGASSVVIWAELR